MTPEPRGTGYSLGAQHHWKPPKQHFLGTTPPRAERERDWGIHPPGLHLKINAENICG